MRKGTPHPTASDTPPVDAPAPRRGRSQASRLLRSSRRGEERFKEALNDDVTLSDFTNLLSSSSAAICLLSFETPILCDTNEWSFTDALYATPSRCVQANLSFARSRSCKDPTQLIGQNLTTLFPDALGYRGMFQAWHNHHLSRDGFEWHIKTSTATSLPLHVACYGLIKGNGLHRLWIIVRELAKKSGAPHASTAHEHHLRTLLDQPGVLFIRTYPDGTVSFCTEEAKVGLGIGSDGAANIDSILGRRCHPSDRPSVEKLTFHRHLRSLTPTRTTIRLITEHRGLRTYSVSQIPSSIGGDVKYYDIIAFETAAVGDEPGAFLTSGFIHDANNHLFIASANVQAAQAALAEHHPAMKTLTAALSAMTQASAIYTQSRTRESAITHHPTTVDVGREFQDVIAQCEPLLGEGVTLSTRVKAGIFFIRVDPTHLRQILTNLILNALEALKGGGSVTLAATRKGKDPTQRCPIQGDELVCVSVSDTGPGIEPSILDTIFTPFVSTKSATQPRGLGLAMVRALIETNNGEISATSAPGIGTTFTFCLPSVESCQQASVDTLSPQAARALNVLVADDEPHIRDILKGALTARGHSTTLCRDGRSLLAKLRSTTKSFDAIIVDDSMPGSSGTEIVEAIRAITSEAPVILISGDPSAEARFKKPPSEMTFLAKPFPLEKLYSALETVASRTASTKPLAPLRRKTAVTSIE